jgi:hypothetical protein
MRINTVSITNMQQWNKDKEQLLGVTRKAISGSNVGKWRIGVFSAEINQRLLSGKPQKAELCLLPASCWILAWLISDSENGGDKLLRNVSRLSMDYMK